MSRPAGTTGSVRQALQAAARLPGTDRQLAERALVGYALAKCTVSRMIDAGELLVLDDDGPRVVIAAASVAMAAA
jgi:hypothetical protein